MDELEKLKLEKERERKEWAKKQRLEFYDEEESDSKVNGLLLALASKRLQGKIYHTPREGSWWSENPDVAAPRAPGVRPNSAVFRWEKKFVHEEEPNVVLDRRTADLMSDVDRARARSLRTIKKAKKSIDEAKATVEAMNKMTLDPRKVRIMDKGLWKRRFLYSALTLSVIGSLPHYSSSNQAKDHPLQDAVENHGDRRA
jgi:hypothetical protein